MAEVTLTLTVDGKLNSTIPLGPFTKTYKLTGQKFDWQHGVEIEAVDVDIPVALPSLGAQTLLMILSDEDVTYKLNVEATARQIKKGALDGGFAIHPGTPNITALSFSGNGASVAHVRLLAMGQ